MRDHTNRVCGVAATMYQREHGLWRFGRKLDSEDGGEHPGEPCRKVVKDPLARGEGPRLSTELPTGSLALARRSNED